MVLVSYGLRRGSTPVLPLTGNHLCQNLRDYFSVHVHVLVESAVVLHHQGAEGKCERVAGGKAANQKLMAGGMSDTSMSVKYL